MADEEYDGCVVPEHVRQKKIQDHLNLYGYYCPRCDKQRYDFEVDHIIPLARGGRNSWYNLQVLCGDCNRQKGTTYTLLEAFRGRRKWRENN